MTHNPNDNIIDDDIDDIDDDFYEDDDDVFDNAPAYRKVIADMPAGWYLVPVLQSWFKRAEIHEWLIENCTGDYKEVNWASGCSSAMGVMLEADMDIILFKLRWG